MEIVTLVMMDMKFIKMTVFLVSHFIVIKTVLNLMPTVKLVINVHSGMFY